MSKMTSFIVVTSINQPTDALKSFSELSEGWPMILVGDRKTPADWSLKNAEFLSLSDQGRSSHLLARLVPENHYSRKNLGYLTAFGKGAVSIFETDDDNAPDGLNPRSFTRNPDATAVHAGKWLNPYPWFGEKRVWPRGYPLELLQEENPIEVNGATSRPSLIQQYLANGEPDVDAVYRLVFGSSDAHFEGPSISIDRGSYAPFNSQSTLWFKEAFPLMYLPSFVTFRMTDIWRSFVAQRCLWEIDSNLTYHAGAVYQARNVHNLMKDFADEIPGYERNQEIIATLDGLQLVGGYENVGANLRVCYEALNAIQLVPGQELELVEAWLADIQRMESE